MSAQLTTKGLFVINKLRFQPLLQHYYPKTTLVHRLKKEVCTS